MENCKINLIGNSTDVELITSLEDYKEPVRRVRPDACRKSIQARRCVQHLKRLKTRSSKLQYNSTIQDNQYQLSYELFNSMQDLGSISLTLNDNNNNNASNCSQLPQRKNILSYRDYLALPIEIRYPYNYVSDLFEDAHPENADSNRNNNNYEE